MAIDLDGQTRGRLEAAAKAASAPELAALRGGLAFVAWWNAQVRAKTAGDAQYINHAEILKKAAPRPPRYSTAPRGAG